MEVFTKQHNLKLWTTGAYGNRLRCWRTIEEYEQSNFSGLVVLRYLEPNKPWCKYNLRKAEVQPVIEQFVSQGAQRSKIMINEAAPDKYVIFNGELWLGPHEELLYSTVKMHMRPALAAQQLRAQGLYTRMLLRSLMTPSSYEDLQVLIETYNEHAIELSIYSICIGNIPGRNALVWEVRKY